MRFLCTVLLSVAVFATTGNAAENSKNFLLLPIDGTIHGGTVELLRDGIAKVDGTYQGLIIELDTPGGLLDATREIVKLMLNSRVPIIVYVGPSGARAGSAGTFITMAANIAAMAPGTNIGAAHPISITGKDPDKGDNEHMGKKIENDTIAFIETIAAQRGRNVDWAKSAVKESSSITESRALELKVIDLTAKDTTDLIGKLDGRGVRTAKETVTLSTQGATAVNMTTPTSLRLLNLLASPTTIFLIIIIFILGLYVEFSHPGMLFPAVASGVALLLLLFAGRIIPISYFGALLIVAGAVLLILEIYVTSFGLLAAGGLSCFFFGSLLLFDPSQTDLRVPLAYIVGATVTVGALCLFVGWRIAKSLMLPAVAGQEAMVGEVATVVENPQPGAMRVLVRGEYWQAASRTAPPPVPGDKVKIVQVTGLVLIVDKL